jgi:hypothetical protein
MGRLRKLREIDLSHCQQDLLRRIILRASARRKFYMGINASIIVYPTTEGPRHGLLASIMGRAVNNPAMNTAPRSPDQLEGIAREVLAAFERRGFLSGGTAERATASHGHGVSATGIEFEPPPSLVWVQIPVDPTALLPTISAIVYTSTQAEWWGDFQTPNSAELLAVPYLDVTLFSAPVKIRDEVLAEVICRTWAVIEFSYLDARASEEIHRVRNEADPLFEALGSVLGSAIKWGVVAG